jgi:hypothetical protein
LFPAPKEYGEICNRYAKIVVAEENYTGQYRTILFGRQPRLGISGVNAIGRMITPHEIIQGVENV